MNYKVLLSTKGLSKKEWLEARQTGVCGSDVPGLFLAHELSYSSPLKVYLDKTTPITAEAIELDNEAMRQGRDLEEYCADRFEKWSKEQEILTKGEFKAKKVRRVNAIIQHLDHDFIIGDLDRRIDNEDEILECKTTNAFNGKYYESWDTVPMKHKLQCYHYLLVTGAARCYLAVLILGTGFKVFVIERDEEIITIMLEGETAFWNNHILTNTPPEWDGSEAATQILKERYPDVSKGMAVELKGVTTDDLAEYKKLDGFIKDLEGQKEVIKQRILDQLEGAEIGTIGGEEYVKRTLIPGGLTLDTKKLQAEKPEIYAAYTKPKAGYVKLTIKEA